MGRRIATKHVEARDFTMTLTRRERRRLERGGRKRANPTVPVVHGMQQFLLNAAEAREASRLRPGTRGWSGEATGRVNYVASPVEYQGTTVQVCGLWPFIAGSGSPVVGVPLGRNLINGTNVCADPISWFLARLTLNPSAFILGRPGLGKTSLAQRFVAVLEAWGIIPMVLGDTKPDYVNLIEEMQGQVIRVGRGRNSVNPLDFGPLMLELDALSDPEQKRQVLEEMRGRRLGVFTGLLALMRGRALEPFEQSIISESLRILDPDMKNALVVRDVTALVVSREPRLAALALDRGDEHYYHTRVEGLLDVLTALGENGPFGDMFSRATTEHIQMGRPMVFDLSTIDDSDGQLLAAAQSVCWNYGSAVVSAEKYLAEAGLRQQRHYFLVMDELWRILRASDQMVYFIDALTRLNRTRGVGQVMITHTMNDLELADGHLTKIAWGFVERSAMVYLGGLAEGEMGNLEEVFGMSRREKDMITDWSAEGGMNPESSQAAAPPGQGKFLLKVGKRAGTPFHVELTEIEKLVNDSNKSWKAAGERARENLTRQIDEAEEEVSA